VLNDALTNASNIIRKGRLGPGQMVCADLERGTFQNTQQLAREVAAAHPYSEWLKNRSASCPVSQREDRAAGQVQTGDWGFHLLS
jgi:hypothetical protein